MYVISKRPIRKYDVSATQYLRVCGGETIPVVVSLQAWSQRRREIPEAGEVLRRRHAFTPGTHTVAIAPRHSATSITNTLLHTSHARNWVIITDSVHR